MTSSHLIKDVLWQYGVKNDIGGYWGVPPWIKEKLKSPVHEFPWPFRVNSNSFLIHNDFS
jgi:hypothetical protein